MTKSIFYPLYLPEREREGRKEKKEAKEILSRKNDRI